ncbi:hypothetical protein ASF24_13840 [Methylobacterium sp. Leaf86]|uniref:hypothetical protein n=1 Tax=Methylobacterium sp. Leaf86 TaxID=1736242 RepID=UPI0006FCBAA2|nr:hypothetical protein [Methylobacterium sp. Leaf86]KQO59237.1 hypothetical protein ASF24_13840 [Methylobacterium sp. Leaf86]
MNVPLDHTAFGTLEKLREEAMEQLHLCSWHSSLAVDQGAALADAGMVYNTRRAAAHLRMAMDVLAMMREHRERQKARQAEGRPHGV